MRLDSLCQQLISSQEISLAMLRAAEAERDASRSAHRSDIAILEAARMIEKVPDGEWQSVAAQPTPSAGLRNPSPARNPAHSPARGSPKRTPKRSPYRMLSFLPGHMGR